MYRIARLFPHRLDTAYRASYRLFRLNFSQGLRQLDHGL